MELRKLNILKSRKIEKAEDRKPSFEMLVKETETSSFGDETVVWSSPLFKFDFAVCLKESDLLIGGCGIRRETELSQVANLGWAINPEFQSKGYATEAARALIDFGIQNLNLSIIYVTCDARNTPSFRVIEKLGRSNPAPNLV